MVALRVGLQFFIFSLLVSAFSSVLSRSLVEFPKTTTVNVSTLFLKTNEILSLDPKLVEKQQQQDDLPKQKNSSFTLKLYPRETLLKPPFKTIRDLTLAKLKRDSARVAFINKKLNLAGEGGKTSDFSQMDIEAPVSSGFSQGTGAYFATFGMGTPANQFNILIDTGSDVNWIQCTPCTSCFNQNEPFFDPLSSSSYKPLTCDSQLCQQLREPGCKTNSCQYAVRYGDNSSTKGDLATETFTFGNEAVNGIALGCAREYEGKFGASGLLGLGRGSVSFPSQIKASSFSYCLVSIFSASASTLEFGSSIPGDAIITPIDSSISTFYAVSLAGIRIGERLLSFQSGGRIIVDSGTTVTRFPTNVYNVLRDEFLNSSKGLPPPESFGSFDTCFRLSGTAATVPTISFVFGTKSLDLPPGNYLVPVSTNTNILCFAFQPTDGMPIIGNIQQQGMRVGFDLRKSLVGFSPKSC